MPTSVAVDLRDRRVTPTLEVTALREVVNERIPTITDPAVIATGDLGLSDDDWVIGIATGAGDRAYPVSSLRKHHIVNDVIDDPILVTFCVMCRSGACFDPIENGRRLVFDLAGHYRRTMTMRDRQTSTIWSQFTGEALVGDLVGTTLEMRPSQLVAVGAWLEDHPLSTSPAWMRPPRDRNDRKTVGLNGGSRSPHENPLVLGLVIGDQYIAYPLELGVDQPLCFEDEAAGVEIVILASANSTPVAFRREVGRSTLRFSLLGDRITAGGSTWTPSGLALDGPHAGTSLPYIPSRSTHLSRWLEFHPDSEIRSLRLGEAG